MTREREGEHRIGVHSPCRLGIGGGTHLLVEPDRLLLGKGEREEGVRSITKRSDNEKI